MSLRVDLATSGGHPGRTNEDFLGATPGAVVMLDGAGIPGTESICRHGVAWYAHNLGGWLLSRLGQRQGEPLADVLAAGIEAVTAMHPTCDVADPSSPQATVAMLRAAGDRVDTLTLADAYVVLDRQAGAEVLTDPSELEVRAVCLAPLAGLEAGSAAYDAALPAVIDDLRSRRNQPEGYWIAKDDPRAAAHAVVSTHDLPEAALVLSNGVSRLVDPYAETTWQGLVDDARARGAEAVLARLREVERARTPPAPDDASLAVCEWPEVS
ncbi:hypothetical protein [Nocardioides bigeumensis]|uniref:Protein phosphatase 2C domain-containing protein n=1 Tax=Nocardioides bigeumensis TaxID=433657 RepID=A0ABN2YQZ3_9ACTN